MILGQSNVVVIQMCHVCFLRFLAMLLARTCPISGTLSISTAYTIPYDMSGRA